MRSLELRESWDAAPARSGETIPTRRALDILKIMAGEKLITLPRGVSFLPEIYLSIYIYTLGKCSLGANASEDGGRPPEELYDCTGSQSLRCRCRCRCHPSVPPSSSSMRASLSRNHGESSQHGAQEKTPNATRIHRNAAVRPADRILVQTQPAPSRAKRAPANLSPRGRGAVPADLDDLWCLARAIEAARRPQQSMDD